MSGMFLLTLIYRWVPVPLTPLMVIRSSQAVIKNTQSHLEKKWVPLNLISSHLKKAVIKAEDDRFFEHNGFDFDAIEKAFKYNQTHIKKRGASTISQQTAKNLFLWPSRDWLRKFFESYGTVLIELLWSKDRILEVYLNIIELGPGVYGAEAASQKFFKKASKSISAPEAAMLAAVLPRPLKYDVSRPSKYVVRRQQSILRRMSWVSDEIVVPALSPSEELQKKAAEEDLDLHVDEFFDSDTSVEDSN